ncbi:unnamed protein product, partial [marine sediment metagenome]
SGLDVIDTLRNDMGDVPAVVITGRGDTASLTEASQRRPLELMTKPLNLDRLRNTIFEELHRQTNARNQGQTLPIELRNTCTDLTGAYRSLSEELHIYQLAVQYQLWLLGSRSDDDVFRAFFRTFIRRSGSVYGTAFVCDSNAELRVIGRFGVPKPDSLGFCQHLTDPLIDVLLNDPHVQILDASDETYVYDEAIQPYLPGISVLAIPLIPTLGEMIGVIFLYRKGEQPFVDKDVELAKTMSYPTAVSIRRND